MNPFVRLAPALLFAAFVVGPGASHAVAASPRIGFLHQGDRERAAITLDGLREGLREHGYVDATSIAIEIRYAGGRFDRLPELARELVRLPVDVLVTTFTPATMAAKEATTTVPIVMVGVSDPIGAGIVASLARPGGNVTGTSSMTMDIAGKSLQLLRDVVPDLRRVAVLWNPDNRVYQSQLVRETEAAARSLSIPVVLFEAQDRASIDGAFEAMAKDRPSAVIVLTDPVFLAHAARIAALAKRARLPSVSGNSEFAEAGLLMTYGPSRHELARAAGGYVARILRGAKPAELPIEQPTKFELVLNTTTAKALGTTIGPSLRQRTDRLVP